jgi:thioredoxin 1
MSDRVLNVGAADFQSQVLDADGPVLVDFWAAWCGPCRAQTPILEQFAVANPGVKVVKVNVDEAQQIARTYGIRSIPTVSVFKGGAEVAKAIGVQRAPQLQGLVAQAG